MKHQTATTPEQSKRLLDSQVNPATADMAYRTIKEPICDQAIWHTPKLLTLPYTEAIEIYGEDEITPAWSFTALLALIPKAIQRFNPRLSEDKGCMIISSYQWAMEGTDRIASGDYTAEPTVLMTYLAYNFGPMGMEPQSIHDYNSQPIGWRDQSPINAAVRCIRWLTTNGYKLNQPTA